MNKSLFISGISKCTIKSDWMSVTLSDLYIHHMLSHWSDMIPTSKKAMDIDSDLVLISECHGAPN